MGYLINIMKSILSLILPDNEGRTVSKRFLKGGRKGIGFQDRQLVVTRPGGYEQGVNCLMADDIQANITTDAQTMSKRFVILSGRTAATTLYIPAPTGELRELIIQNANTSLGVVAITAATATIFSGSSATVALSTSLAINTSCRLLSNGTNWYRVS